MGQNQIEYHKLNEEKFKLNDFGRRGENMFIAMHEGTWRDQRELLDLPGTGWISTLDPII